MMNTRSDWMICTPVVLNTVKSSCPCYSKHYQLRTLGNKGKNVQSHYCSLELLQLSTSRREKNEEVNQEEKVKRKGKNRQREGTFAENSLICKKENGGEKRTSSLLELIMQIEHI